MDPGLRRHQFLQGWVRAAMVCPSFAKTGGLYSRAGSRHFGGLDCDYHASSLTASASSWLEEILRQVHSHYSSWLCSDPVTRLTIRQQAIEAGTTAASEARCALLSQGVTNLLLEAVPSAVRAEVVTVRALTPVGILFLLHTRYQPAGQAEKASILQFLVAPEVPKNSNAAIRGLRRWIRWLARATELQLSSPDASLLIKAVDCTFPSCEFLRGVPGTSL